VRFIENEGTKTDNLVSSTFLYKNLAEKFKRAPSTMRKIVIEKQIIKPAGFTLVDGTAVNLYSKKSVQQAIKYFENNPPIGSGRPKGSLNRIKNDK